VRRREGISRVPGAAQHGAQRRQVYAVCATLTALRGMMRCRTGTATDTDLGTAPDQRCSVARCTASGARAIQRREFIALLGGAAVWPVAARAQQTKGRPFRIGYLSFIPGEDSKVILKRLDELGYRQGENLEVAYRSAEGQSERLSSLAAELVAARPDVLVAGFGTLTANALKAATGTIPIVFASVGDPVGLGLIASLNRPGGNVTGVTSQASDVVGKRLQIVQELLPGKRTLAVLLNPDTPFSSLALQELRTAATAAAQPIQVFEARTADQVLDEVTAAAKVGVAGVLTLEDPLLLSARREIAERAIAVRLPVIYGTRGFAEAGGLISYGVDRRHLYGRLPSTSTRSSRARSPPICRWNSQPSSSL
jgi:putative ABC transport system substrate-binding protein